MGIRIFTTPSLTIAPEGSGCHNKPPIPISKTAQESSYCRENTYQPSGCTITRRLWSSIALSFGGFSSSFTALVEPLSPSMSLATARTFFKDKLPDIVHFASKHPEAAWRIIAQKTPSQTPIWSLLVSIACGDRSAALSVIDEIDAGALDSPAGVDCVLSVAKLRPTECRHVLQHLFGRVDSALRLKILHAFVNNSRLSPIQEIGDMFVKILARSTPDERNEEIYPELLQIVGDNPRTSPRHGFLAAILKGWISECPKGQVEASLKQRISKALG